MKNIAKKLMYNPVKNLNPIGVLTKSVGAGIDAYGRYMAKNNEAPVIPKADFDYTAEAKGDVFSVGFGRKSILPPDLRKQKYYMAGYSMYKPTRGILDTIYAHAIWIDDKSGKGGVVFVSLDAVGMSNRDILIIRKCLKPFCERTGCRSVQITCTHTHAGIDTLGFWGPLPKTGQTTEHMNIVRDSIIYSCETAYASRRDGALYLGSVEVEGIQGDGRTPVVYSKALTRLRFAPSDGSREIFLINFAAHPETLSDENVMISADYTTYFREKIRDTTGADTIFFSGALGGMITTADKGSNMGERIERTKEIGCELADCALGIKDEKRLSPKISMIRQELYFEVSNYVLMTMALLDVIKADRYFTKNSPNGLVLKTEMNYFEIDSLKMLMLPGEIFPEFVYGGYLGAEECSSGLSPEEANPKPLIEIAGDPDLLIFGLANDEVGYMVPPNDFLLSEESPFIERGIDRLGRRHYEETNSLGIKTGPKVAEVFAEMMEAVKNAKG
ncbi:MAG: neutral/alkaline non-lysosomal ceramidase N-terminal domain-containing protein [Oscillospiraceae bacterium]|nr:neutral/alkaline non-lysosomal ceramidase N-terminal domain-containing protein [Oscillospiraceae bacterium]